MISFMDGAIEDFLREKASLTNIDISFEIPTKEWSSGLDKNINLYLFDIRENTELRKNKWETVSNSDGTITQQKPPARIDLFYIITAYNSTNILVEHHLLSKILAVVHDYSFIPEDPYLIDNLTGISPIPEIPIEAVHPKFLDEQGGFQLWSAIDQYLKPAIYIKVTIPIDLQKEITATSVLTKMMKYGQIVRKRSYELRIHPYTLAPSFVQSDTISKVGLTDIAVYGDTEIKKGKKEIELDDVTGLNQDDILIIIDGKRTEFCQIDTLDTIFGKTINLKEPLLFDHPKGVELRELDTDNPQTFDELKLVEAALKDSDVLMVAGKEIQNLKMGDIIHVEDTDRSEYFQITEISARRSGIEITDTFIDIGGLVTNKAAAPIVGANVILEAVLPDTSRKLVDKKNTDENGRFLFNDVVDGKYTIKADAEGYQEKTVDIDRISEAKKEKLIIRLEIT